MFQVSTILLETGLKQTLKKSQLLESVSSKRNLPETGFCPVLKGILGVKKGVSSNYSYLLYNKKIY